MIESPFAYCPLIWIFCPKKVMQIVEKVQYQTLQVVYNNYMATYDELIALDNKLKIHQRHLQFLAMKCTNLKINLTQVSCGKHIRRKISHIHWEGVFPS